MLMNDLEEMAALRANPEVMLYISHGEPHSREKVEKSIGINEKSWNEKGFGKWSVRQKGSDRLMGWCGLGALDQSEEIEVGYGFAKEFWGQAFATEAATASLRFGFEHVRLDRIVAVAFADNLASLRVIEKIGLKYERIGHYYGEDLPYYALNRIEYRPTEAFYALSNE